MKKPTKYTIVYHPYWGTAQTLPKDSRTLDNEMRNYATKISKTFPFKTLDIELEHITFHYKLEPHYELLHYSYAKELELEDSFVSICKGKYEILNPDSSFPHSPEAIIQPNKQEIQNFAEDLAKVCKQKLIKFTIRKEEQNCSSPN